MLLSRPDTDNLRHAGDPQVRCYSSRFSDAMEMLSPAEGGLLFGQPPGLVSTLCHADDGAGH